MAEIIASMDGIPGRSCPLHYRYPARGFRRAPDLKAETLIVAGGLYGNVQALDALVKLAEAEPGGATLVLNGDFHWFDIDTPTFARISNFALAHHAIRGNVETELATLEGAAGCGCAYPQWVSDAEVERSNRILELLKTTAAADPVMGKRLAALPMHLVAEVGGARVAIVHGDAESLSGWAFSQESVRSAPATAARQIEAAGVKILACSHTCLPVLAEFELAQGRAALINNGAAGMPNFAGTRHGVVTRISLRPTRDALYSVRIGDVYIEALALAYDADAWLAQFDEWWPKGSPAALSYRPRIVDGPRYAKEQAVRGWVTAGRF